jgi:hypothetical protein
MVSATPIPFMLDLVNGTSIKHEKKVDDIEFFNLDPQDNHVGVENIVPLLINGKEIYLEQKSSIVRAFTHPLIMSKLFTQMISLLPCIMMLCCTQNIGREFSFLTVHALV